MSTTQRNWLASDVSRRTFLRTSAIAGSATVAGMALTRTARADVSEDLHYDNEHDPVSDATYVYSTCLMCHSDCGIKVRVVDGVAVKIEGNPYHPQNREPDEQIAWSEDPSDHIEDNGRLCAKGQAGIETLYNPYRLKQPLRRVGARGEGKWETVSWDDALDELAAEMSLYYSQESITNAYGDDLGPMANKVVFSQGRFEDGPADFSKRFFGNSFGTINANVGHTSICESSRHVAGEFLGQKHLKPDVANSQYIMTFGTSPLEASFPMQSFARKLMRAVNDNGATWVVVDPRGSNSALKANAIGGKWVPIKPGTDAALALAMSRYIVENGLHDETFLRNPNSTAAEADGETCWSDATYLVRDDNGALLTMGDVDGSGSTDPVVLDGRSLASAEEASDGTLLVEHYAVNSSLTASSAFQLYYNRLVEHSMGWYADQCDVTVDTIEELAAGLAAAGKKGVVDVYRGPAKHPNGTYSVMAIMHLNTLLGNYDHKGGMSKGGGHWHGSDGNGDGVDLTIVPGGYDKSGTAIWRAKSDYFDTEEYRSEGLPARRPWFPLATHGVFQEILPSMYDQYPYGVGVYITYCNDGLFSAPGQRIVGPRILGDTSRLPYFVAFDIDMNETSSFADLVLPDTTYLERWGTPHCPPVTLLKASPWRQPVVGTINKTDPSQDSLDPYLPNTRQVIDVLIDLGKRMGLPGVGSGALDDGSDVYNAWDYHGKRLDNLVADIQASGYSVTAEDIEARGGFFEEPGNEYDGEMLAHTMASKFRFYIEELGQTRDSISGSYFDPLPKYEPPADLDGNVIEDLDRSFPFALITYKPAFHTQSRTALDPSLMMLMPENFLEMNMGDGVSLGLETGDRVRVVGPNGGNVEGRVKLVQGMKPGVVAISGSYGHWALSSRPYTVDGAVQDYDETRAAGLHACTLMRLDDYTGDVCFTDKVGGSASFYDTRVRIEKL